MYGYGNQWTYTSPIIIVIVIIIISGSLFGNYRQIKILIVFDLDAQFQWQKYLIDEKEGKKTKQLKVCFASKFRGSFSTCFYIEVIIFPNIWTVSTLILFLITYS